MTPEARGILIELLRLAGPAASRSAVNRAKVPSDDVEFAKTWVDSLGESAAEECTLLAKSISRAKGNPAVIEITNEETAWAIVRALSSIRITLRESVFPDVPDSALESEQALAKLAPKIPSEQRHALACYDCFGLLQFALIDQLDKS
jgi:hypothetical protein